MRDPRALTPTSTPREVRLSCRRGAWSGPTAGLAEGFVQANLVVVPADVADDFREFCRLNPGPCPLLGVSAPGEPRIPRLAADADLRTDLPRYRVFRDGHVAEEVTDISAWWQDDLVAFLLGCSFTFDAALRAVGIPVRHVELGCNVPMYRTSIPCVPVGPFRGNMVVSMRPLRPADAIRATLETARLPHVHGEPVHLGFPEQIGIGDLRRPDFGDAVPVYDGELPVFWACGVTPQVALEQARLPLAITHAPGCMFVSDVPIERLLESTWEAHGANR